MDNIFKYESKIATIFLFAKNRECADSKLDDIVKEPNSYDCYSIEYGTRQTICHP